MNVAGAQPRADWSPRLVYSPTMHPSHDTRKAWPASNRRGWLFAQDTLHRGMRTRLTFQRATCTASSIVSRQKGEGAERVRARERERAGRHSLRFALSPPPPDAQSVQRSRESGRGYCIRQCRRSCVSTCLYAYHTAGEMGVGILSTIPHTTYRGGPVAVNPMLGNDPGPLVATTRGLALQERAPPSRQTGVQTLFRAV